jgi:hypothetical protein
MGKANKIINHPLINHPLTKFLSRVAYPLIVLIVFAAWTDYKVEKDGAASVTYVNKENTDQNVIIAKDNHAQDIIINDNKADIEDLEDLKADRSDIEDLKKANEARDLRDIVTEDRIYDLWKYMKGIK